MHTLYDEPIKVPMRQLVNHFDDESAFIVKQYPYQGRLTRQRHWVETRQNIGQRHVFQNLNPITLVWQNKKQSLYSNIVLLLLNVDPDHIECGHITPLCINLETLSNTQLFDLALKYSYTEFQRNMLMQELTRRGFNQPPPWKTEPAIDLRAAHDAEYPLPRELQVERKTNEIGIIIETFEQAAARVRKERAAVKAQAIPASEPAPTPASEPAAPQASDPAKPYATYSEAMAAWIESGMGDNMPNPADYQ